MTDVASRQAIAVKRSGDRAFVVDLGSLGAAMGLRAQLETNPPPGVSDVVAAASTVMVVAESPRYVASLIRHVSSLDPATNAGTSGRLIDVPVVYDGDDLASLAGLVGQSVEALVNWHTSATWVAAFTGFAPGFVYLVSDSELSIPRRASPRTAVPRGSVGLADTYSAVYPRSSPGGWQLIGRTDLVLFDETTADPALIHPGDQVRFRREPAPASVAPSGRDARASVPPALDHGADVICVHAGVSATIQDLGRAGHADLGVGPAGAMDRGALTRANRIVGNAPGCAALEVLGAGFAVRAVTDQVIAVTGAASRLVVRSPASGPGTTRVPVANAPFALLRGEELTIDRADTGTWSYVAFRGGIDAPAVLGSRSRDTHAGLGPEALASGEAIAILPASVSSVVADGRDSHPAPSGPVVLRVVSGPRDDWFAPESVERFFTQPWTVSNQFSRMACRLTGPRLERVVADELQSEGLVRGSVQVPPEGQPLVFAADHPVTGGYPVIGVVVDADLDAAAQLRPGDSVRFSRVPYSDIDVG